MPVRGRLRRCSPLPARSAARSRASFRCRCSPTTRAPGWLARSCCSTGRRVASATFGDNAGRCVTVPGAGRTYNWIEPCPKSGTATVQFDTTKVADGEYQAQLVAEDASGNRGVAAVGPVVLRNATAIGPGSPLAVRGAANGTPSDDAPKLSLAWKRGATVRPSPTIELPWSTGEDTIVGRLLTAGGQPIGGARVRIAAVASAQGASEAPINDVTTSADGWFEQRVLRGTGSMTVTARYFARRRHDRGRVGDPSPARCGRRRRSRRRGVRRAARGCRSAAHSMGAPAISAAGADRVAGAGRRTVADLASAQTGSRGLWQRRLRFATQPGRYLVRARVGTSVAYPYARGGSRVAVVSVR